MRALERLPVRIAEVVANVDLEPLVLGRRDHHHHRGVVGGGVVERLAGDLHHLGAERLGIELGGELHRGLRLRGTRRREPWLLVVATQAAQPERGCDRERARRGLLREPRAFARRRVLVERDRERLTGRPAGLRCEQHVARAELVGVAVFGHVTRVLRPLRARLRDRRFLERHGDTLGGAHVQERQHRTRRDGLIELHRDRRLGALHAVRIRRRDRDRRRRERTDHRRVEHRTVECLDARFDSDLVLGRLREMWRARSEHRDPRIDPLPRAGQRGLERRECWRRAELVDRDHRLGEPHADLGFRSDLADRQDLRRCEDRRNRWPVARGVALDRRARRGHERDRLHVARSRRHGSRRSDHRHVVRRGARQRFEPREQRRGFGL